MGFTVGLIVRFTVGFNVGFTVGSVGFKRYLVSIIVTHCGISRSTSQPPLVEDLLLFSEEPIVGL